MSEPEAGTDHPVTIDAGLFEFDFVLNDTSGLRTELSSHLERFADFLGKPELRGTLYAVTQEMASNALKAVYKRLYHEHLLETEGRKRAEVPYDEWLALFKRELANNGAENFARLARLHNQFVQVSGRVVDNCFRIEVENEGAPTDIEMQRIQLSLENAREVRDVGYLFQYDDTVDTQQEGAGLGIPLIMTTVRGMGINPDSFSIFSKEGRTFARLDIPLELFAHKQRGPVTILSDEKTLASSVSRLFDGLDYCVAEFDADGSITAVTASLLGHLNLTEQTAQEVVRLIPPRFFSDVFRGPRNIRELGRFENYRIWVPKQGAGEEVLFNVSGLFSADENKLRTLWQPVVIESRQSRLSEGSIMENLQVQNVIKPYIPPLVLSKAREVVRHGLSALPDETKDITVMFGDMVGFTHTTERIGMDKAMGTLNIALGLLVRSIERHHGQIDKFMGDAVMALFRNPHEAVIAAVEIQRNFAQLNEFRQMSGQELIEVRIGMHSGQVILGNVGTTERRDLTPIGDVVNTASRIERSAAPGSVLIGGTTYERVKEFVDVGEERLLRVKGKETQLQVFPVRSVSFNTGNETVQVSLEDIDTWKAR